MLRMLSKFSSLKSRYRQNKFYFICVEQIIIQAGGSSQYTFFFRGAAAQRGPWLPHSRGF
jgi:hypothetical protein